MSISTTAAAASSSSSSASVPSQINSPLDWAIVLLKYMNLPVTTSNVSFLVGWAVAEGGAWHNTATGNPLNTTLRTAGSKTIANNSAGVQAYPSWAAGIQATAQTLQGYPEIMAGLRAGDAASADLAGSMGSDLKRWSGDAYQVVPPSSVSSSQVANLDLSWGQIGSSILKDLGWAFDFGASGAAVGSQAVGGVSGAEHGINAIGHFFNSLGEGVTWIRLLEIVGGFLVMGLGLYLYVKIAFPGVVSGAKEAARSGAGIAKVAAL